MSEPFQVKVSRDGIVIGTYEAKEAFRLLIYGTLKETDFYWHEGMTEWAPLPRLKDSEVQRALAERAHQAKQEQIRRAEELAQEEAKKAEIIAQEKARAKEEKDRVEAEAVRFRLGWEKANYFRCHCCRKAFPKPFGGPEGDSDLAQVWGVIILLLAILVGLSNALGLIGSIGCILIGLMGLAMYWGPEIRSRLPSLCPHCRSTNFSKPQETDVGK